MFLSRGDRDLGAAFQTHPGDRHSSRVEAKNPALLSNRDGYLLELTGWTQGSQVPEAFGERSRDWSLGHAGDEGPHLAMTGESRGCSRAAAPVCAFSRGTTVRSVSLSWGAKEVGSPCEWRGGARHCSRAMVGCRGPAPAVPGYSKERRRRRRSGNNCLIKC